MSESCVCQCGLTLTHTQHTHTHTHNPRHTTPGFFRKVFQVQVKFAAGTIHSGRPAQRWLPGLKLTDGTAVNNRLSNPAPIPESMPGMA